MRSLSIIALAAIFFVAIGSAAPPHTSSSSLYPAFTFEDVAINSLQNDIDVDKLVTLFKCTLDVVGNAIGESDLKTLYLLFKREYSALLKNDLIKCKERENITKKYNCVMSSITKLGKLFGSFMDVMTATNKEIAEKIQEDLKRKCVEKPDFYDIDATAAEPFLPTVIETFECVFGVLGEVSKQHGFAADWQKYEPEFKKFIDSWKQCRNAGGKIKVIFCNAKKYLYAPILISKYTVSIVTKPGFGKMIKEFVRVHKQKCLGVF